MNVWRSSWQNECWRGVTYQAARALLAVAALAVGGGDGFAQSASGGGRYGQPQPLDGPNVTRDRDLAAGAAVDSLFDSITGERPRSTAATQALGVKRSKAATRPSWSGRLARNPKPNDGNPPFVLIDRYGGIQRYVEPVAGIELEKHLGQLVTVRRDTGAMLLASQLELPRSGPPAVGGASRSPIKLATFEEAAQALEPVPAPEGEPALGEPIPPQGEIIDGEIIHGGPLAGQAFDEHGHPLPIEEGVDPLYLDDGEAMALPGCPNCGSTICQMQGGCGFGSRPMLYARGEYLLWWFDGMPLPRLVVRGDVNEAGTPGDPTDDFFDNAVVAFGNQDVLDESRSGGRVTLGYWLDDYGRWAIEGDYFGFGEISTTFVDGGNGTFPIVGRPFIDATSGLDAVEDVSFPGIMGTVTVDVDSTFQSAGLRFRRGLCCTCGSPDCGDAVGCGAGVGGCAGPLCGSGMGSDAPLLRFFNRGTRRIDMTYGVRWAQLREGLNIRENLEVIEPSDPTDVGTTFVVNDNFSTSNEFIGGELGFLWDWQYRRWSIELLSRLGIGNTRQRVAINGYTINTPAGDVSVPGEGGLLTQRPEVGNIGRYEHNELSVLPQLGVTLGYMLTDRLKLTGGYTFLYWSRVVRPGDQIDLEVNPGNLPFAVPPDADGLPARPQVVLRDTDIWAHGLNVGLEYQW
ncbi:MAG: BBP7 family outer membrane beta-barrel protein [Pirellulales bacterium]|nr:BBP7 family outer membrane beta-barrel protein [Pirellulales bacterium]